MDVPLLGPVGGVNLGGPPFLLRALIITIKSMIIKIPIPIYLARLIRSIPWFAIESSGVIGTSVGITLGNGVNLTNATTTGVELAIGLMVGFTVGLGVGVALHAQVESV